AEGCVRSARADIVASGVQRKRQGFGRVARTVKRPGSSVPHVLLRSTSSLARPVKVCWKKLHPSMLLAVGKVMPIHLMCLAIQQIRIESRRMPVESLSQKGRVLAEFACPGGTPKLVAEERLELDATCGRPSPQPKS